jgi:hypothetical protein
MDQERTLKRIGGHRCRNAGMQASLDLANSISGLSGGNCQPWAGDPLDKTFPTNDCAM